MKATYDPTQAAEILHLSPATLASWRSRGVGPAFVQVSRTRIIYTAEAIEQYLEENTRHGNTKQERKLALPVRGPRTRIHGGHRLGGYKTKRERREDDRSGCKAEGDGRKSVRAGIEAKAAGPGDQGNRRRRGAAEDRRVDEIVQGDLDDIDASEFVLVNATRESWGTAMEVFYAHRAGKKVAAFVGSSRVSPWLRKHTICIFITLDEACEWINRESA